MRVWQFPQLGLENLTLTERPTPTPGPREVLVKIHAVSLNYRELLFAWGKYNPNPTLPAIPCSDGAGEVVAVGSEVTRWRVGDRVTPIFMQGWIDGAPKAEYRKTALGGGDIDGTLAEYGTFHEDGLVAIPDGYSYEEAATLPCAAVTAWNAVVEVGRVKAGDTVLTLGSGGVSVFALQFAKMHGARVIATSGSDEKRARLEKLGADATINYKTTPDWEKEVLTLTGGQGVDNVVEVGGAGTIARSAACARVGGTVSVIGVLTQGEGLNPVQTLMRSLRVQGIFVGSRTMFEAMNRAIEVNKLRPVIDRSFAFDEAPAAFEYLKSGAHFGKIVIRVSE